MSLLIKKAVQERELVCRDGLSLERVQHGDLTIEISRGCYRPEQTEYVAGIYYGHKDYHFETSYSEVLEQMLEEDRILAPVTTIYSLVDDRNTCVGSIRTIMKLPDCELPLEREFGIQLSPWTHRHQPIDRIYEIARFAVTVNTTKGIMMLFRELFKDALINDFAVASLDSRVLRGLRKMGFHWFDLQEPKYYLGSLTCPVALKAGEHIGGIFADIVKDMHNKNTLTRKAE
ncbi:hypothetical protein [Paenibacillus wynnii]|uniref:hypothetical protein n=1 Tax=Paenibacillus wynnii TaxID=268407 RepID=UPI002794C994|nr:hypothetical protein [Paenibacillus wynnii]MDQ0195675.1 hypothetical protein [Paenibacillus wynnii]